MSPFNSCHVEERHQDPLGKDHSREQGVLQRMRLVTAEGKVNQAKKKFQRKQECNMFQHSFYWWLSASGWRHPSASDSEGVAPQDVSNSASI